MSFGEVLHRVAGADLREAPVFRRIAPVWPEDPDVRMPENLVRWRHTYFHKYVLSPPIAPCAREAAAI